MSTKIEKLSIWRSNMLNKNYYSFQTIINMSAEKNGKCMNYATGRDFRKSGISNSVHRGKREECHATIMLTRLEAGPQVDFSEIDAKYDHFYEKFIQIITIFTELILNIRPTRFYRDYHSVDYFLEKFICRKCNGMFCQIHNSIHDYNLWDDFVINVIGETCIKNCKYEMDDADWSTSSLCWSCRQLVKIIGPLKDVLAKLERLHGDYEKLWQEERELSMCKIVHTDVEIKEGKRDSKCWNVKPSKLAKKEKQLKRFHMLTESRGRKRANLMGFHSD